MISYILIIITALIAIVGTTVKTTSDKRIKNFFRLTKGGIVLLAPQLSVEYSSLSPALRRIFLALRMSSTTEANEIARLHLALILSIQNNKEEIRSYKLRIAMIVLIALSLAKCGVSVSLQLRRI